MSDIPNLLVRRATVLRKIENNRKRLARTKTPTSRTKIAQMGGCLTFNLLQIEGELRELGVTCT